MVLTSFKTLKCGLAEIYCQTTFYIRIVAWIMPNIMPDLLFL